MKARVLLILPILFFASSCATLLNKPDTKVTVYTTEPTKVIFQEDTLSTKNNKVRLTAERNKDPLVITAITDSLSKTLEIKSENSFMFYSNILNWGLGMLVDMKNPKRYSYPGKVYINSADTLSKYYRLRQSDRKGEIDLHVSIPEVNAFYLHPDNEGVKSNVGFLGVSLGLDYYHSRNQFLGVYGSAVMDFFLFVPAAVDVSGEYESMRSTYVSVSNNHKINRFSLGYGISFGKNTWNLTYHDRFDPPPPTRDSATKSLTAWGLVFPVYFQCSETFHLGIIYRPTFYRPNSIDKFEYEHLISFDLAWKIKLKR